MADRFDKFTERARKVLTLAQEEAQRINHNYIGTEHLLLGLVREGDGVAARVLSNMGVQLPEVRAKVELIIGRAESHVAGEIGLSPRAKKVIELAVDEARRLNHHYIGTQHLLLGLVREGEGIAAGALESLGVNLEKARAQVTQVVSLSSSYHHQTTTQPTLADLLPDSERPTRSDLPIRKVLTSAREEARRLGRRYVGTLDLLRAILSEDNLVTREVLRGLDANPSFVRHGVECALVELDESTPPDTNEQGFTPDAWSAIEETLAVAGSMRPQWIGGEHLLLGVLKRAAPETAATFGGTAVTLDAAQHRIGLLSGGIEPIPPTSTRQAVTALQLLQRELEQAIVRQDFERAVELRDRERKLRETMPDQAQWMSAAERAGLTPREREVLQLLAQSLTDGQIAERLFISRRTASHYVSSILAKLGASDSRVAGARPMRRAAGASDSVVPLRPEPQGESTDDSEFGALTGPAQRALSLATSEAMHFKHNYVGTEHLLLGLVRSSEGNAARVLESIGVQLPKVRSAVEFIIGRGESTTMGELGLTPRAKKVIELAVAEARHLKHERIGTEHLLLGLIREGEGIAAGVLESLGVNLARLRARVDRGLQLGLESAPGEVAGGDAVDNDERGPDSAW